MQHEEPARRLAEIQHAISRAARTARRDPASVTLIAVSKTRTADEIRPLIDAGHRAFGENRVQEAEGKWPALRAAAPDIRLHLIGSLQSNKAADAVRLFDAIHSVDRPSLVDALGKAVADAGTAPELFVQVNVGEEPQKGGVAPRDLPSLLDRASDRGLTIGGLMCLPPADVEPAPYFALLAKLGHDAGLPRLSMGMSGDFETAVTIGATHVRIGTALFGERA
ncbi:hypothetical protein GGR88_002540 [Sphingomonas jejuensis]|uniref:Pyridoxal phosphate homeostasis protein n=1 Tax=Sphingomonas jejuensis TaxID=904715 RepID=A0ABX0XQS7_9SPHN|nr:YggS family pyridoxal phosphate-dependent enzyme [Sphingomonas jejuensis]NJC35026.1 hypothetical protein [Sphingomonas jejuensis]